MTEIPTLTSEEHDGEICLVLAERRIAWFADIAVVVEFWAAYDRAMLVAREVGRQGIG